MLVYLRLFKESFSFALNALRNNKLRTFLSLLGVTIGIFSIIAILTAVDSLDQSIKGQLDGIDKNLMYVTRFSFGPSDIPVWKRESFPQTSYDDFEFVKKNVGGVEACAFALMLKRETLKYEDKTLSNVNITPVSNEVYEIDNLKLYKGRFYNQKESDIGAAVVVLGYNLAEKLFENEEPIGKIIRVYGRKLTVIGVLKKFGGLNFDSPDEKGFVPVNFVRRFLNISSKKVFSIIMIKPEEGSDINAFESVLREKYRNHKGLKPDDMDNFFILKLSGSIDFINSIISILNGVGWVISGFSLLVGGFGIANIMFVSVKERTNLIGIQKSLGAKNRFILFQFLFESVILALIGGLIGLALVWITVLIGNQFSGDFEFVLSFGNALMAFIISSIIGVVSGIIPAISASKLDPVEAIRSGG